MGFTSTKSDIPILDTLKAGYQELFSTLARIDPKAAFRFVPALKDFLRHPITLEQAEEEIKQRLQSRGERFLSLVQSRVYGQNDSPYLKLFRLAGCEFADLQAHVRRYGLETTLEDLARRGVHFTPDEFKGKRDVVRGGSSFRVKPSDLDTTGTSPSLGMQTTGASNRPRRYSTSVEALALRAAANCLFFAAHDLFPYAYAVYDAILPANGGVRELLVCARFGVRAERWFARRVPLDGWPAAKWHELMTYLIVLLGNRFGPGFPRPEFVDTQDAQPILDWIVEQRHHGKFCCIRSTPSNAARIARSAWEKGISLDGTKFRVSGEPFTEAKREAIERAGAHAIPIYGFEGGAIGFGCVKPAAIDDLHIDTAKVALIARPHPLETAPDIHPLLITTLDEPGPRFYLNVDLGDYATLTERRCGCLFEAVGLTRHIHHIRSYEKFTTEGMNYFYGDLFDLLEGDFPAVFGGGTGDYQLVEEEDGDGRSRLTLVIHPQVAGVDEEKVLARLIEELERGSRSNEFQSKVWQDSRTLRVRRQVPFTSPRGKILPLHTSRSS